ncbi:response regulator [Ruminococcaceae bacterium OttesenSCG-928-I18]|nr:response regulator [Ruminococcaceae bacterium OttesenSCG-928-I18]
MNRYNLDELVKHSAGLSVEAMEELAERAGVGLFNLYLPTGEICLNHTTTLLTGYEPGDLPHSRDTKSMLTFEDDRGRVEECMGALLSGKQDNYQLEYRMRRRDGSIVSIYETAIVAEYDEEGNPARIAGLSLDLSKLKWAEDKARLMEKENRRLAKGATEGELAEQNRLLRATNSAAAMVIGGFHQDYETVLRQALQILGESVQADRAYIWRNQEVDGQLCCFQRSEWAKIHTSEKAQEGELLAYDDFMPGWREFISEKMNIRANVSDLEEGLQSFPGMQDVVSLMILPLFLHGEFWGFIGFDDCSGEHVFTEDEAEIMASGALVIASSISRNETFGKLNEAREAAMASTKAKGEFLSRMSHEIRTPMNAIIGMTTIAKRTEDPDKIRYCLSKVDASSRQLLNLINDVLDMSKIDANKLEITNAPFDFEKMAQTVLNVVQVKLEEKHQDFRLDFDHVFTREMVSDELRLSQVLINLLGNAIKFTPEEGCVTLRVRETPKALDTSLLHIEVVDTGIGIDSEKQEKLFQSFEQVDGSITRQYGGTGLGLAITKKIIDLMGGEIWVESNPGEGARFIFEIEVAWAGPLPPAETVVVKPEDLRVLVVDDSEDVLEYFSNILGSFSLECDTAKSGAEAIALVQQSINDGKPYDIVFTDWNMPGLDGGETAEKIRRLVGDEIITVMISVSEWSEIEQEAKQRGVTNFLSKPVLPSVLYNTIVGLTQKNFVTPKTVIKDKVPNWSQKRILLAEDIEINREIIQSVLEETQIGIEIAEDGQQACSAFDKDPGRYDLILMDVQMPCMDGLEATRCIRSAKHKQGQTVPIVAMTANAFKEDEETCLKAGMNAHVAKPLNVDELYEVLHRYLDGDGH